MKKPLLTVLLVFVLVSAASAYSATELAQLNPTLLVNIYPDKLLQGSYSLTNHDLIISYSEYDTVTKGYGAFQFAKTKAANNFTYFAAIPIEKTIIGLDIGRDAIPDQVNYLLNLGLAYDTGRATPYIGIKNHHINDWDSFWVKPIITAGLTYEILPNLAIIANSTWDEKNWLDLVALVRPEPNLSATISIAFADFDWHNIGVEIQYKAENFLFTGGYDFYREQSKISLGMGVFF